MEAMYRSLFFSQKGGYTHYTRPMVNFRNFQIHIQATRHNTLDTTDASDALSISLTGFGFQCTKLLRTSLSGCHDDYDVNKYFDDEYVDDKCDGKNEDDGVAVYLPFAGILSWSRIKRLNKKPSASTMNIYCLI